MMQPTTDTYPIEFKTDFADDAYPVDFADATARPVTVLDISHWQGKMNPDKTIAAGADGIIIRAGSIDNVTGVCYTDYHFYLNADDFQHRIPMGCYWYFRPNHDPIKQADYFSGLLNDVWWKIPPGADVECNPNSDSPYNVSRWLYKFLLRVEANIT